MKILLRNRETLVLVICVVLIAFMPIVLGLRQPDSPLLAVGTPVPEFYVERWISPSDSFRLDFVGKVTVLNAFSIGCFACKQEAPELVRARSRFKNSNVQFVSLTFDDASSAGYVKDYAERYRLDWPVGYGAEDAFFKLGIERIPSNFVIGPDGKVAWHTDLGGDLAGQIEKALASVSNLASSRSNGFE